MVLNHLGGIVGVGVHAGKRDEIFESWRQSMAEIATCPNVIVKFGRLNMAYNGFGWHKNSSPPTSHELCDATRRYYETAIAQFGLDRCMFESNFPVDKLSCSYPVLWNAFKRMTAGYAPEARAKLF